ncbi:TPA: outer membrane beta-barrel family protein [Elizabethkingia anophelis]
MKINIFLFLIFCQFIYSQQFQLTGKIVDEKNNPIESVEILLIGRDSIAVKSELTDVLGLFSIHASYGEYTIQVKQMKDVIYSKKILLQHDYNLGEIKIIKTKNISEVQIEGKKKLIEKKIDRIVFNVENSVTATGGDALDALKVTPNVRVQNDQVFIIGKSKMSIMIDDRLMQFSEEELVNFLRTIKSDDIKSIEVITNPPAKYDAEGNSGIINIKLKKIKKNNISGNLKTTYTQAKYPQGNFGGGLNYQKNKFTIVSNLNYSNGSIAPYQEYTIYYPTYKWFEINNKRNFQNNLSGRVAIEYQMTPKTTIGIQYSVVFNKPLIKGSNTSYITNNNSTLDSLIVTPSRIEMEKKIHSLNFHTTTKVDTLGSQYSIDVDYYKFNSNLNNNFKTNTYFPNGIPVSNRFISANNLSNQNIDIYSAKFDYEKPLKWINLSFGAKASFIKNDSKVSYFNTTMENSVFDTSKSNVFNYHENTQALYISGNKKLSEKWDLQLGLRLESTQTKGYSETLDQTTKNNYIRLFPTFFLTYKMSENSTLGLNYSRRIDRPTYKDLNPFRFYSSAYNYSEGNPFLQPFYIDNAEISYTHKNYFASIYMNYMTNGFDQVTFVSNDNPVQRIIPYNFYKQLNTGITQNYSFSKWNWLESNNMISVYYSQTTSDLVNTLPKINKWVMSFNSNNSFILNKEKTLKAELNFIYQSSSIAGSYTLSSFYYFDAGIRYLIFNKKFQVALNIADIFRTNKLTFTQVVNNIKQNSYEYGDVQKIRFSLTWNFGKQLKNEKREQSNEDEKSRAK